MDTRLLKHYETELAFVREMGAEFAQAYPKIAGRLGMDGIEINDPYVERLIESFAFLTSRIQLELDMRYPQFTQHLLEIIYPHYLSPVPAMFIAQFQPEAGLSEKYTMKRGTKMRAPLREGDQTACEFRTAHDVDLWPLKITEVQYFASRGEVVAAGFGEGNSARGAIRLRLKAPSGTKLKELGVEHLDLHLPGQDRTPWALYEHLMRDSLGIMGRSVNRRDDWSIAPRSAKIEPIGFTREESLLPFPGQSFDGYRLLQEYFSLPQRFFFSRLAGLSDIMANCEENEIDLYILLKDTRPALQQTLTPENFALYCTPAINLLELRCDRVHVQRKDADHFVVVDRTAPMDFEIHTILDVDGITSDESDDIDFRPFYSADDYTAAGENHEAYYAMRRRFRQRSENQKLKGTRTSYLGTDVFLSLVDRSEAPYSGKLEQLAIRALCTNRDLPMLLQTGGGGSDFDMTDGGPVDGIRAVSPISAPKSSLAVDGSAAWRLISHLSLNYLSMDDADRGSAAAGLRELLGIYTPKGDRNLAKQLEGIAGVESRPIVRRMADEVLSTAVRGLEVKVTFDESYFEGTGVYLLGAVLEQFFASYVSLNSFTETVISGTERGEIARWSAKSGRRRMI
ncbi:MAG: type VI secretion system baseplate subunit TssF [Rhodobacteraceae bacterium]|nr:type VI secretion system baseplate subunit TssF [Paracoccaceae bacterium]